MKLLPIIFIPLFSFSQDIVINKDTTINNVWIIPETTILRFESNGFIRGNGSIKGGVIDAAKGQHIFDTSITINPSGTYGQDFSCAWFGAKSNNPDNYSAIQKSINTCIKNGLRNCFLPKGNYNYSRSLKIENIYKGIYVGVSLKFYGESDSWDERTVLNYYAFNGFALGVQLGKGVDIGKLTIKGMFTAPTTSGSVYYNTLIEDFGVNNHLSGLVIDYDGTKNSSGSTAVTVHDMKVTGFTVLYSVSPNGITYNADILSFNNIQCGEGRICFQSGQAQEKGNSINGIYSWGKIHTLISIGQSGKFQAGNYTINLGNVAGGCIRLFDIRQSGWYSSNISNFYAESIGTIGNLTSGDSRNNVPLSISNSTFHFAPINQAGAQTLVTSNSNFINFSNCLFRYYGSNDTLKFSGIASFNNCFFSGKIKNATKGSVITNYQLKEPKISISKGE